MLDATIVTFNSSRLTDRGGELRMNFRNICQQQPKFINILNVCLDTLDDMMNISTEFEIHITHIGKLRFHLVTHKKSFAGHFKILKIDNHNWGLSCRVSLDGQKYLNRVKRALTRFAGQLQKNYLFCYRKSALFFFESARTMQFLVKKRKYDDSLTEFDVSYLLNEWVFQEIISFM